MGQILAWPQCAFTAFSALLPSANYYAEWSGPVWQPPMKVIWSTPNSHYSLQWTLTPNPASSKSKKVRQMAILIYNELLYPTGWALGQHSTLRTYHGIFFKERETLWGCNMVLNLINMKWLKRKHSALSFSDNNYILQCDALVHERFRPLHLASAVRGLS